MQRLYQVFDNVSRSMLGPVLLYPHDGPAARAFRDLVVDKSTQIGLHPADYVLVCLGTLDDQGVIEPEVRVVVSGESCLALEGDNA